MNISNDTTDVSFKHYSFNYVDAENKSFSSDNSLLNRKVKLNKLILRLCDILI